MSVAAARKTPETDVRLADSFFAPKSMAIVGASPDFGTIRGRMLEFPLLNSYPGKIYPVHPTHKEIEGIKVYPTITSIGAPVDLAIIVIPAKQVVGVVEECAKVGIPNVMIIASGFAEEGGDASNLQEQLVEISARTGIRIAGPNCEGFYSAVSSTAATFSPTVESIAKETVIVAAPDKRIGVVSQSGGQGFSLFTKGRHHGLAFSHVISSGNEVDLTAADFLEYMVHDPNTQIVMMLCESIRDGERFKRAARAAELAGKPIVMVKLGRSEAGARAAASHTASLTGSDTSYRAVFKRYGIIEAGDPDEAVAIAALLATSPLPNGRRVGVVTASGGGGGIVADVCATFNLSVPEVSESVQALIRPLIPKHASPRNPVDITAQGGKTGPVIMKCMEILDASDDVDMIVIIISTARANHVSIIAENIKGVTSRGAKPVVFWTYTLPSKIGQETAARGGAALFSDVRHVALALSKLADYADHRRRIEQQEPSVGAPVKLPADLPKVLSEHRVKSLLSSYGLSSAGETLVQSADDAAEAASALGFPVVLKIQSPDVLHKTEVGGVKVGLADKQAVKEAYNAIAASVKQHKPNAVIEGMLVQKMAPKGYELVAGVVEDPTFGPIVMAGFGGVTVELFGDVAHRPAPVSVNEARAMLDGLLSAKLLKGFRGAKPVDITPMAEFVARISQAAAANRDRIKEMEFNPIILHADGSGLTVADALVVLK